KIPRRCLVCQRLTPLVTKDSNVDLAEVAKKGGFRDNRTTDSNRSWGHQRSKLHHSEECNDRANVAVRASVLTDHLAAVQDCRLLDNLLVIADPATEIACPGDKTHLRHRGCGRAGF